MFTKKTLLSCILFFVFVNPASANPRTILDLFYSCGRVRVSGAAGSGTIVSEKGDNYYVLSNAHVKGNSSTGTFDMWPSGKQQTMQGKWVWSRYEDGMSVDLALLEIPKSEFKGWTPKILKLAPYELQLQQNSYIFSIGSPRAYHSLAWNGRVYEVNNATFTFNPTSISGQSGSSILANIWNKETQQYDTQIVGILTWSTGNGSNSLGAAQKHQVISDAIAGRVAYIQPIPEQWKEIESRVTELDPIPDSWIPVAHQIEVPEVSDDWLSTQLICPYCGSVHPLGYIGPCPGGNCPLVPRVPSQPSPTIPSPIEPPPQSPEFPDLTQPPILDGPPNEDANPGLLKTIQDSIKSTQDALKSIESRLRRLEGGWVSIEGIKSLLSNAKQWGKWLIVIIVIGIVGFVLYTKIAAKGLTTAEYSQLLKKQISSTETPARKEW